MDRANALIVIGYALVGWGMGAAIQKLVLYTCATKEMQKKGCFLKLNGILVNHDWGSKRACF